MPDILTNAVALIGTLLAVLLGKLPNQSPWMLILYIVAFLYSPLMVIALALVYNDHPILGLIFGIVAISREREKKVKNSEGKPDKPQNRHFSDEYLYDLAKNYENSDQTKPQEVRR